MRRSELGLRGARPPPIDRLVRPFRGFAHVEASGGVVLLAAAPLALVLAGSVGWLILRTGDPSPASDDGDAVVPGGAR